MKLINETQQQVTYFISDSSSTNCGTIEVDGIADLPQWDNRTNVKVTFMPASGSYFVITCDQTGTGEQVEMLVVAE
jgi:hypothetical protein